jgi:hypothetical protein
MVRARIIAPGRRALRIVLSAGVVTLGTLHNPSDEFRRAAQA